MSTTTQLLTCLAVLLAAAPAPRCAPQVEQRPNILFILADDQSPYDLVSYDPDSPLETPNLDRLAAEGMTLDGAYHRG
jgi:arylsulfatase A-like enzyme